MQVPIQQVVEQSLARTDEPLQELPDTQQIPPCWVHVWGGCATPW